MHMERHGFRQSFQGVAMKIKQRWWAPLTLFVLLGSLGTATYSANESQIEARQMKEDTTPRAHYNTSKKEANAAYNEALKECRSMGRAERSDCMKEAQTNLRNDLAQARETLNSETGMGSSGTPSGSSGSGMK
jgi:hypothetical protein